MLPRSSIHRVDVLLASLFYECLYMEETFRSAGKNYTATIDVVVSLVITCCQGYIPMFDVGIIDGGAVAAAAGNLLIKP